MSVPQTPRCWNVSPHVRYQDLDGEAVLLDLERQHYFGLNEIGTRVWRLLGDGASRELILDRLGAEYDVSRQQLEADVDALLEQLQAHGLIIET